MANEIDCDKVVVILAKESFETGYLAWCSRKENECACYKVFLNPLVYITHVALNVFAAFEQREIFSFIHTDVLDLESRKAYATINYTIERDNILRECCCYTARCR